MDQCHNASEMEKQKPPIAVIKILTSHSLSGSELSQ